MKTDWEAVALATEPADRDLANLAVARAYEAARLPLPRMVWVDSPSALKRVAQKERERVLAFDHPLFKTLVEVRGVRGALVQGAFADWWSSNWREDSCPSAYGWFWWGEYFGDITVGGGGYPTVEWLSCCAVIEADSDLDPWQRALVDVARQTLIWLPLNGLAILCDRPELLEVDDAGRLHCTSGEAIRWRDGSGLPVHDSPGRAFIHGQRVERPDADMSAQPDCEYHNESRGVGSLLG